MDVQFGPNAVEEPGLLYKLQRKVKLFNTNDNLPNRGYNLVTSASKYGIVFVGAPNGILCAYRLCQLMDKDVETPQHTSMSLNLKPTHLAVNSNQELLVVVGNGSAAVLCVSKIGQMPQQTPHYLSFNIGPSAQVTSLQWNPCIPESLAVSFESGKLWVGTIKATVEQKMIEAKARCVCWSPKGKQLVVGTTDGMLCQYKPELVLIKTFPAPNLFEGAPVEAIAVHWLSTYQFAVVFRNASDNSRPVVTIVNTSKGGPTVCFNYEDICYSMGTNRPWYYYLLGLPQWNIVLAASSNSMEVATLGSADGTNWIQWTQSDEARPELPLTDKKKENYPVGVCIDNSQIHQLPWGENDVLPFMPQLLVLSDSGVLSVFNVLNVRAGIPNICQPVAQPLMLHDALLTCDIPGEAPPSLQPQEKAQPPPQPATQTQQPPPPPPSLSSWQPSQPAPPAFSSNVTSPAPAAPATPQPVLNVPQVPKPVSSQAPPYTPPAPAAPAPAPAPAPPTPEENAALKATRENTNRIKAEEELNKILMKEFNDFQMQLYSFRVKTLGMQKEIQASLNSIEVNRELQCLDSNKLKQELNLEEVRCGVVQLKLELVRAAAAAAEARAQAETKDQQWAQLDPLSVKRLNSVRQLAYYIQTQLDQANKAVEYKWNEMDNSLMNKPGQRMLRPVLDEIYQPLVKQQEILSRQQATLRAYQKILDECNDSRILKAPSLLRSTPFKTQDNLSKLTKNILNMSIEPEKDSKKQKALVSQKLEALRDMLSNRKTVKIKPVNMELSEHLAAMRSNYEKTLKEKQNAQEKLNTQIKVKTEPQKVAEPTSSGFSLKQELKPDVLKQTPLASETKPSHERYMKPSPVARTLFADEPAEIKKPTPIAPKPQPPSLTPLPFAQMPKPSYAQQSGFLAPTQPLKFGTNSQQTKSPNVPIVASVPTTTNSANIKSVLKDMLMNKSQGNEASTFMGQKICSPTAFEEAERSASPTHPLKENAEAKKDQPVRSLGQTTSIKQQEQAPTVTVPLPKSQIVKPKPSVPDVVKIEKEVNIQEQVKENVPKSQSDKIENAAPNLFSPKGSPFGNSAMKPLLSSAAPQAEKPTEESPKPAEQQDQKGSEVKPTSTASSIFAAANTEITSKPSTSLFGAPVCPVAEKAAPKAETPVPESPKAEAPKTDNTTSVTLINQSPSTTSVNSTENKTVTTTQSIFDSSSTSIFASAANSGSVSPSGSIFSGQSAFGTKPLFGAQSPPSSVFGTANTTQATSTSVFSSPTTQATPLFGTTTTTQSLFGTPTTTSQSIFATATTQSPSLFGTPTAKASIFGTPTTQESIFGTPTKAQPLFGAATTAQSLFGASPPTTTASVFGTSPTTASVFGASPATTASIFGAASPVTTAATFFGATPSTTASIFGAAPTSSPSIFGTPTNQAAGSGGSIFGAENLFSAASISTTNAASPTTGGSIFGGSPSGGSVFGGGGSVFGAKPAFGAASPAPAAASIFGGGGASSFGAKTNNNLWGSSTQQGTSTFGATPFGQQTTQASTVFGTGSFSSPASPGQAFGAAQSGGSVFGSPTQQTGSAFGSPPAFGAKPAFGQTATFGSPSGFGQSASFGSGFGAANTFGSGPTFGGGATFGSASPTKVFGGAAPTAGFGGSPTQSNSTFENLATQNTLTFGNLAQQSGQPPAQPQPTFNTSPSFTGWRS